MEYELCVASLEAARIASTLPLTRIETCTALEQGGLTPTTGMVSWIHSTFHLEQHILIRQRAGGFQYSYDEILVMRDDVMKFREIGVKGIVVGALKSDGSLDKDALEAWHRAAGNMDLTFHRAFDEVKDWKKTMDQLINMGFRRILTSGQAASVAKGLEGLKEMVEYAAGRIEIMAGGGVRPDNAGVVKETGVNALHFSGTVSKTVDESSLFSAVLNVPDRELILQLCES